MTDKLRIGKISYVNIYPVFHVLESLSDLADYTFVEKYPSALNQMLRENQLDISPSSSIEYLRDESSYNYLPGHSISARGPIGSIMLFSRLPIESLSGREVFATHQSATSVGLLHIVLKRFYGMDCTIKVTDGPFSEAIISHPAYLTIGDEALFTVKKAHRVDMVSTEPDASLLTIDHQLFYVYDLSNLWFKHTGLPFVFALWIVRKDSAATKGELIRKFTKELDAAREALPDRLGEISRNSGLPLPPRELEDYWRGIIYGLDDECIKGLSLFKSHLKDMGLL